MRAATSAISAAIPHLTDSTHNGPHAITLMKLHIESATPFAARRRSTCSITPRQFRIIGSRRNCNQVASRHRGNVVPLKKCNRTSRHQRIFPRGGNRIAAENAAKPKKMERFPVRLKRRARQRQAVDQRQTPTRHRWWMPPCRCRARMDVRVSVRPGYASARADQLRHSPLNRLTRNSRRAAHAIDRSRVRLFIPVPTDSRVQPFACP